jgi:hypothetical protein
MSNQLRSVRLEGDQDDHFSISDSLEGRHGSHAFIIGNVWREGDSADANVTISVSRRNGDPVGMDLSRCDLDRLIEMLESVRGYMENGMLHLDGREAA